MNLVAQELDDGALLFAVSGVGNPSHALRAIGGSDVGQLVDVATAPVASALRVDGLHDIAGLDSLGEHAKAAATHDLGKVNELHAKADVGAVATKAIHGLFPRHALQREFVLDASGLENFLEHTFHHVDDVVLLNERHLDVDLSELRLAVGAQVLVAEAASDLVVALDAAHHEHLLELLRALRKRVELARVGARRNQVVASAFGRGVRQNRRFDLEETALVEGLAHSLSHGMAKLEILVHLGTAKVHVAPLHARGFVGLDAILDRERRRDRGVQHLDAAGEHFNLARRHVRIHGAFSASAHFARDFQHELAAEMLGNVEFLFGNAIGVDHDLRVALAVAKVHENQAAVVAVVPHPASEGDLRVDIGGTQLAARVVVHAILVDEFGHRFIAPCEVKLIAQTGLL